MSFLIFGIQGGCLPARSSMEDSPCCNRIKVQKNDGKKVNRFLFPRTFLLLPALQHFISLNKDKAMFSRVALCIFLLKGKPAPVVQHFANGDRGGYSCHFCKGNRELCLAAPLIKEGISCPEKGAVTWRAEDLMEV